MATALCNDFSAKIEERVSETAVNFETEEEDDDKSEEEEVKTKKKEDVKSAMSGETDASTADYNNVLAFLQSVKVKAPMVVAVPLQLHTYKRTLAWFGKWDTHHISPLSTPITASPRYRSGLTGVLSNVTTRLHNSEAIC